MHQQIHITTNHWLGTRKSWSTPNPKAQFRYIILIKYTFSIFAKVNIRIYLSIKSKKTVLKKKKQTTTPPPHTPQKNPKPYKLEENLPICFLLKMHFHYVGWFTCYAFELLGTSGFISYCFIPKHHWY